MDYELSQNGSVKCAASDDKDAKRSLLKRVFKKMTLDEGKLEYEYTDACQIIFQSVSQKNSSKELKKIAKRVDTFELQKKTDDSVLEEAFLQARPILLPVWDFIRTIDFLCD